MERCNASNACLPGSPLVLDDADDCTIDSCDPVVGVRHEVLDDPSCTDGNWIVDTGSTPSLRDSFAAGVSPDGPMLVFGGDNAGAMLGDTWSWDADLAVWKRLQNGTLQPTPRAGTAAAVDTVHNRLVVFGGVARAMGGEYSSEIWEYDFESETWLEREGVGPGPAPRAYAAAAYDGRLGRVVIFGGTGAEEYSDTWAWNTTTGVWQNLAIPGPSARHGAKASFDSQSDTLVLFGGTTSTSSGVAFDDTWTLSSGTWTRVQGALSPEARTAHSMAFDQNARKAVLFGGTGVDGSTLADTWLFDVASRTWTQAAVSAPAPRAGHELVYDSGRGTVMAVGGLDYSSSGRFTPQHMDVWELRTGAGVPPSWAERSLRFAPFALAPGAAYDESKQTLVTRTESQSSYRATWVKPSAGSWSAVRGEGTVGNATTPGTLVFPADNAPLLYDKARSRVVSLSTQAGDWSPFGGPGRIFITSWDGQRWTNDCTLVSSNPSVEFGRSNAAVAYDDVAGEIVLFGGQTRPFTVGYPPTKALDLRLVNPGSCSTTALSASGGSPIEPPWRGSSAATVVGSPPVDAGFGVRADSLDHPGDASS